MEKTMPETRAFFVPPEHPNFTPEQQESAYVEFAAMCHSPVPEPGQRIYSIRYNHDGTEWTATVGETLRGVRRKTVRSRGVKREQTSQVSDPATVLAIFPGVPYQVVTSEGWWPNVRSGRVNPFMAGQPTSMTYFAK